MEIVAGADKTKHSGGGISESSPGENEDLLALDVSGIGGQQFPPRGILNGRKLMKGRITGRFFDVIINYSISAVTFFREFLRSFLNLKVLDHHQKAAFVWV